MSNKPIDFFDPFGVFHHGGVFWFLTPAGKKETQVKIDKAIVKVEDVLIIAGIVIIGGIIIYEREKK